VKNGPCNVGSAPYDPGPLCVQHGGTLVLHVRCHQNQTMLCGGHLTIPCSATCAGSRPNVAPKRQMAEASLQNLNKPRICSCWSSDSIQRALRTAFVFCTQPLFAVLSEPCMPISHLPGVVTVQSAIACGTSA